MISEKRLLFVLATIQFCHIIDFMIIMPLGKTIMGEFGISPGQFAWVVSLCSGGLSGQSGKHGGHRSL